MNISFCTVSKNRTHHVRETLAKNIKDNENDPKLDFVLLDYNSNDGLEDWVNENMGKYIERGTLAYYRTNEPTCFRRSHSRNMAFRLAKGDVICNVDADNFTGAGFSLFIQKQFEQNEQIFICGGGADDNVGLTDFCGRICVKKTDFFKIGGYDERMTDYGFEDFDLINRLQLLNLNKVIITDSSYSDVIKHNVHSRISEESSFKNIKTILVSYISPYLSKLLFIFIDGTCFYGTVINERVHKATHSDINFCNFNLRYEYTVSEKKWVPGRVTDDKGLSPIIFDDGFEVVLDNKKFIGLQSRAGTTENILFHEIKDPFVTENAIMFYSQLNNRMIMDFNKENKISLVNNCKLGNGIVYKNFDYCNPIIL